MTFELELGETHVWCSSPDCARRLVERGARFIDPRQAEHLRRLLDDPAGGADEPAEDENQRRVVL